MLLNASSDVLDKRYTGDHWPGELGKRINNVNRHRCVCDKVKSVETEGGKEFSPSKSPWRCCMDSHCDTISFCQAFKKFSMRSRLLHTPVETNEKEKLANAERSGKGRYGAHGTKGESKNGPRVLVSDALP
jgi:hypothetical protein